jgi:hypothetical protein
VNDFDRLRTVAEAVDGIIHAAFNHDFSNLKQHSENDRKVIMALGDMLAGSNRPLVIASGTGLALSKTGGPASETDGHARYRGVRQALFQNACRCPRVDSQWFVEPGESLDRFQIGMRIIFRI